jgi:hypothetical protein
MTVKFPANTVDFPAKTGLNFYFFTARTGIFSARFNLIFFPIKIFILKKYSIQKKKKILVKIAFKMNQICCNMRPNVPSSLKTPNRMAFVLFFLPFPLSPLQ